MRTEHTDALVGSMLGKDYRVIEPIGAGGMAVVYLVEHQKLLKQFAAKVLSPALASSLEARARFTQEAHAASQLDHENIVSITDFGVTPDQRPYFVMELLRGQTLDERLADRPMSIEEVVAVAVPVARALAHAHAEGIVHLDVKPENIFLMQRSQGRWGVKVVDFGIAKTPLHPRVAQPDETAGSPMFMAPEVCRGDADVDQRADIYSFGILLYLMMCGRLPFVDDNLHRVLQMQLVQLPAPPREVNTALSPELAMIVERALAKDPDDRYPSMEALLLDLEAALPPGADRLLIEAQSGTSVADTPFAGSLAIGRQDSGRAQRPSQPPPVAAGRSMPIPFAPDAPGGLVVVPAGWRWRRRARDPVVIASAIASTLIGVAVMQRLISTRNDAPVHGAPIVVAMETTPADRAPTPPAVAPSPAPAVPPPAPAVPPPSPHTAAAVPAAAAEPEPAAAVEPDPEVEIDPPAATAPVREPATEVVPHERAASIGKRSLVRTKPMTRREPSRPSKRVAAIAPTTNSNSSASTAVAPGPLVAAVSPPEVTAAPAAPEVPRGNRPEPDHDTPVGAPPGPVVPPSGAAVAPPAGGGGSLDAVPAVTSLDVKGSLSPSVVRRSVERTLSAMRSCYHTAAGARHATDAVELKLTFQIDEDSRATQIATGGDSFGSLASCAAAVVAKIRTQEAPDVGTAQVTVVIRFRPS